MSWFVWGGTATLTLLFVSLVVVAPIADAHGYEFTAAVLYEAFGKVCHQIGERSFYIDGHPLAVCARCTGIYFGFAGAVLIYPFVRSLRQTWAPARKWLLVALVPAALDFTLDIVGVWANTHVSRSLTGALLGGVTAFFVMPGVMDLTLMIQQRRRLHQ